MDTYFIGIYWGARKESIETCSKKLHETFLFLSNELEDGLSQWYKTRRPKKNEIIQPIELNESAIKSLLFDGRNINDDGSLNEDLGYTVYLKSQKDFGKAVVFSSTCGCYNKLISNSVTIRVGENEENVQFKDKVILEKIYSELVRIWSPERGVIKCNETLLLSYEYDNKGSVK